jgi:hypothetical protein
MRELCELKMDQFDGDENFVMSTDYERARIPSQATNFESKCFSLEKISIREFCVCLGLHPFPFICVPQFIGMAGKLFDQRKGGRIR